jgi:transposase-like protein
MLTPAQKAAIVEAVKGGASRAEVARAIGTSTATVSRLAKRAGIPVPLAGRPLEPTLATPHAEKLAELARAAPPVELEAETPIDLGDGGPAAQRAALVKVQEELLRGAARATRQGDHATSARNLATAAKIADQLRQMDKARAAGDDDAIAFSRAEIDAAIESIAERLRVAATERHPLLCPQCGHTLALDFAKTGVTRDA